MHKTFLPNQRVSINGIPAIITEFHSKALGRDIYEVSINNETRFVSNVNMTLDEGVRINSSTKLAAFVVAVAEAYDAAPSYSRKDQKYWNVLIQHTKLTLFKRLKGTGIKVVFQEEDPYDKYGDAAMKFMMYDIVVNHQLKIYTGFSDNHPTFSEEDNIIFRAVHDFFTHAVIRKNFVAQLKAAANELKIVKLPELDNAGPLLDKVTLHNHAFTARGEFNATSDHIRMAPREAAPAIFTEVTGQVSYYTVVGDFPSQKVAALQGFDYQHIGQCVAGSKAEKRVNEVMQMIESGEQEIALKIKAKPSIKTADLLNAVTRRG
jgi:hypothetical protein